MLCFSGRRPSVRHSQVKTLPPDSVPHSGTTVEKNSKENVATSVTLQGRVKASPPENSLDVHQRDNLKIDSLTVLHSKEYMEWLINELTKGTHLYKVKSPTRLLQRKFFLDTKSMVFYYEGSKRKRKSTEIQISKIREVREGEKDFSKKLSGLDKRMCFALVLSGTQKIKYLMASQNDVRDMWIRGLRYAVEMDHLAEQRNEMDKRVRDAFNMADKNGDNSLDFDEVMKLLKILNADIKKKYVKEMFEKADTNKSDGKATLDREEFVRFYNMLTRRPEIEEIFIRYSRGKGFMYIRDVALFLKDQKMPQVDEEFCKNFIKNIEPEGTSRIQGHLTVAGFQSFLMSEKQHLFNPKHTAVYQDMTQPITNYFIASSHNTYLAEDQLKGPSKVEMYISALTKGCRCVELDCWDGPGDEPVIYHGYTLTSKILFRDVIHAVKEYAFKTSLYPVTLSLENHCGLEQQEVMAKHLEEILGDMIWAPEGELSATPSPEELRMKIILKGKKLPLHMENDDNEEVSDEDESAESGNTINNNNDSKINNNNNEEENEVKEEKSSHGHKKIKLSPALSRLTGMKSVGFKDVHQTAQIDGFFQVVSLGENKLEKLMSTEAVGLNKVSYAKLIRTYPAGSRTDSSNYSPTPMWNHGCQLVALNYQTGGEPMQLNHGRFLDNGGCGYILKPNCLLKEELFGILNGSLPRNYRKELKLTIISGVQIPKPKNSEKGEIIDPFIKIEMHGAMGDNADYRTKVINNNGFNPRWYETCVFSVRVPELAILRFVVKDEDRGMDDFIGYYALPFTSLQEGYRHFPLYDIHGDRFPHTYIFLHVAITDSN